VKTFTYGRMLSEVQLLGAMLREFGVTKGDRVIIYMPMVPEAVFAMLACARIGAGKQCAAVHRVRHARPCA
jgi:propionyl-CoA synthetase